MTLIASLAILAALGLLGVFCLAILITLTVWLFVTIAVASMRRESPRWREFL